MPRVIYIAWIAVTLVTVIFCIRAKTGTGSAAWCVLISWLLGLLAWVVTYRVILGHKPGEASTSLTVETTLIAVAVDLILMFLLANLFGREHNHPPEQEELHER